MKLNVPFYLQTSKMNCGPAALRMVLAFFGEDYELKKLEENVGIKEGYGVATIQIGIGAAQNGFKSDFYSTSLEFNESNTELEFYKKYAESDQGKRYLGFLEKARNLGMNIEERSLELKELLNKISEESLPIVLLDWNIVKGEREKGYQGHFVPIVGYDEESVIIHNHGLGNPKEFMRVPREVFEEARKAKGTDEDVLVIYRKS